MFANGLSNLRDYQRRWLRADVIAGVTVAAVDSAPEPVRWLLLNTEANVEVDITAVDALDALREELAGRGIVLALARVKQDLRDDLVAAGFLERLRTDRVFMTLPTAVEAFQQEVGWQKEQHSWRPR